PIDREPNLAVLNDPPLARVGVHPLRRFLSRRHRDVIAVQRLIIDDRLGPVGGAFVLGEELGDLRMRLVRARPTAGLDGFRRPDPLLDGTGPSTAAASSSTLRYRRRRRASLLGRN